MTNTPGDDAQPPGSAGQPPGDGSPTPEQPGYWQQQQQQPPTQGYPQQGYPQQPPQQGWGPAPSVPQQYAPDHPRATTVLVLGILGLVLCQVLSPVAWVMGRNTLREIDASQGRMGGRGSANAGYVLGIIGSVLLGLGLLFGLVILVIALIGASTTSSYH